MDLPNTVSFIGHGSGFVTSKRDESGIDWKRSVNDSTSQKFMSRNCRAVFWLEIMMNLVRH